MYFMFILYYAHEISIRLVSILILEKKNREGKLLAVLSQKKLRDIFLNLESDHSVFNGFTACGSRFQMD